MAGPWRVVGFSTELRIVHLYLIRHGIAEPYGTPGVTDDASRELTDKGEERIRRNGQALVRLGEVIDEVWTSPLERARRTADLLAQELGVSAPVRIVEDLGPEGKFDPLLAALRPHLEQAGIALVGHEPGLGELATYLLTGVGSSSFRFKKGGVACIEVYDLKSPPHCQLRWLLTPKQMAAIAGD